MNCPNCKNELIVVERDKIELDYCLNCRGFWFDNLEWDILSRKLELGNSNPAGDLYAIPSLKGALTEAQRNCPICTAKMEKFMAHGVLLDRCPNKHGIWFDEGEVSKLFNSSDSNFEGKTPISFLGELFYKNN